MSFCVAGPAIRDIPTCVMTCQKWFCVAGAILFGAVLRRCAAFFVARAALWRLPMSFLCMAGAAHSTCHVAYVLRIAFYTFHSTLETLHFTLYTQHFTPQTLHSTLHTLHFTLYTLHSTLYTLHSTLYTPHSTPTLRTPHFTLYTPHFTLYTPHSTLYTPHSTLSTPHSTVTFDSGSPYLHFLQLLCIRVRLLLLFWASAPRSGLGAAMQFLLPLLT